MRNDRIAVLRAGNSAGKLAAPLDSLKMDDRAFPLDSLGGYRHSTQYDCNVSVNSTAMLSKNQAGPRDGTPIAMGFWFPYNLRCPSTQGEMSIRFALVTAAV